MSAPVRILQVTIGDGSFGGVASFLYNYYAHMDHDRVHFDFLYCGRNAMASRADTEVLRGSTITELGILKASNNGFGEYRRLIAALKDFFDRNRYDIVHVNSSNPYVNACVAHVLKGRTVYIAHSHNTEATVPHGSGLKRLVKSVIRACSRGYICQRASALFACSVEAGAYLFGEKNLRNGKFRVINNAIDVTQYAYDPAIRRRQRDGNGIVVGYVGRLAEQKNPLFAIEVFKQIHARRPNAVLWMVGEGELMDRARREIEASGLGDRARLPGRIDDVSAAMQGMDLLLFPSLYEGFGIVAIEAQCSALPVLASDSVPAAANVTGLVSYLPLSIGPAAWAEAALAIVDGNADRCDRTGDVRRAGFDIREEAGKLERFYINTANRE